MAIRYWWWILASTAVLLFWPAISYLEPLQALELRGREQMTAHLAIVGGHFLAGVILGLSWSRRDDIAVRDVSLTAFACIGLGMLFVLVTRIGYSRIVLLGSVIISLASYTLLYLSLRRRRSRLGWAGAAVMSVAAVAAAAIAISHLTTESFAADPQKSGQESRVVNSAYYPLEVTEHFGHIPMPAYRGGAITTYGDDLLMVTGDGIFYRIQISADRAPIEVEELPFHVPMNRGEFLQDLPEGLTPEDFRAADLLVLNDDDGEDRLFVSHLYWKRDQQCYVVRVSETALSSSDNSNSPWTTLFESSPCISYEDIPIFRGYEMGGRMIDIGNSELLLTVGDFGFGFTTGYAQNAEASYGKVLRIDIEDGSSEPYSLGHRNPQGLLRASDGEIWSTEHGPRGGDELNHILEGHNYGWPYKTYGTAYERHEWPVESAPSGETTFMEPIYSWVPSVGVSNLIESQSPLFPMWEGDFLVASMRGRTLYRVHLVDNDAILAEPIPIGGRIRDLTQDEHGRVVMWMDAGSIIVIRPVVGTSNNAAAFITQCGGCHQVDGDGRHGIGPDLQGVFGRPIASAPGYNYSDALAEKEDVWDEEALRSYLADPQGFAPGTKMAFVGLMKEDEMDKIIAYLESLNSELAAAETY